MSAKDSSSVHSLYEESECMAKILSLKMKSKNSLLIDLIQE